PLSCYSISIPSCFFIYCALRRLLHSFPTRRSSDLLSLACTAQIVTPSEYSTTSINKSRSSSLPLLMPSTRASSPAAALASICPLDRKSTRLNSSHEWISYAVFCLKKKKE